MMRKETLIFVGVLLLIALTACAPEEQPSEEQPSEPDEGTEDDEIQETLEESMISEEEELEIGEMV